MPKSNSIDSNEIARFSRYARDWWNPKGALGPLHKLNPARIEYIESTVCEHFNKRAKGGPAFKGLSILDIGCGGGLLCEPMARLGAKVMGVDASVEAIDAAREHAAKSALKIDYRAESAEKLAQGTKKFDVITAMEILEHVADIGSLLRSAAALLKPDGIMILSTVNRTTKSYLLGIVAAEYILGWVPSGTHDWRKFIRPSELAGQLQQAGLTLTDVTGMVYHPINDSFRLSRDRISVNYLAAATLSG